MKLRTKIAATLGASFVLGGCETTDWDTIGAGLSLYSDISYISGDCPFGLHKTYDREGHHHCLGEPGTHVDRYTGDHDRDHHRNSDGDATPAEEDSSS
jgi:hypothetical protein